MHASPIDAVDDSGTYLAVKSRRRKPSAKVLESIDSFPITGNSSSAGSSTPSLVDLAVTHQLTFECAVAEVIINDEDETVDGSEWISRASSVIVEKIPCNLWRNFGWSWKSQQQQPPRKTTSNRKSSTTPRASRIATDNTLSSPQEVIKEDEEMDMKMEETIEDEKVIDEIVNTAVITVPEDTGVAGSTAGDDYIGSGTGQTIPGDSVKRKRGRPFKGQEKPIEERLLIETSKIRRLIEDILRKTSGGSIEFCNKLKKIVTDIDDVMSSGELSTLTFGLTAGVGDEDQTPGTGVMDEEEPTTISKPNMRLASRALILTEDKSHVLLVKFDIPNRGIFWALPGGGKEEGESYEDAIRRELREEVGLDNVELGPHIWNRHQLIEGFGKYDGQSEQIYLVTVGEKFEPKPEMTWEELNAENVFEIRWWSLDELSQVVVDSTAQCIPSTLPRLVIEFAQNGPPVGPVQIGVQ